MNRWFLSLMGSIFCLFFATLSVAGEYSPLSVEVSLPELKFVPETIRFRPPNTPGAELWRLIGKPEYEPKIELLPDGEGTYSGPCVRVCADGVNFDDSFALVANRTVPAAEKGKVMLFKCWMRFQDGLGRLNATALKDGKPVSVKVWASENAMSAESAVWNQVYVKVPCTGEFDAVQLTFNARPISEERLKTTWSEELTPDQKALLNHRIDFLAGEISLEVGEPLSSDKLPKVEGYLDARPKERMTREFVALPALGETPGWYLSWRLFTSDGPETTFDVYRREKRGRSENFETAGSFESAENPGTFGSSETAEISGEEVSPWVKLNSEPLTKTTDFQDATAKKDGAYEWKLVVSSGAEELARQANFEDGFSIKLRDPDAKASRVAIADLDGDGRYDYVVLTNKTGWVDPYYYYWRPSQGTLRLEAYSSDGNFLWGKDLDWGIEAGIWYSPFIAADLDGDGCAEVAVKTADVGDAAENLRNFTGRVDSGAEYLSIWDGKTGNEIAKVDWPSRNGLAYNYYCRNMLTVAYLDGKTPFLIALRGTYSLQKMLGWQFRDGKLEQKFLWTNAFEAPELWGRGAHTLHSVDVDGDGRDELAVGTFLLDDTGATLWAKGLRHPDHIYFADIIPSRPGLEVYWGVEGKVDGGGMGVLDAKTGEFIWKFDETTYHIHASGMCGDIDPRYPGLECFGGEDKNKNSFDRYLWTAEGKLLQRKSNLNKVRETNPNASNADYPMQDITRWPLSVRTFFWDADPQHEMMINSGQIYSFGKNIHYEPDLKKQRMEFLRSCDVLGDWREELLATAPGELRIYVTRIPAENRRPTLMEDRNYRATVLESSMGYAQSPLLSEPLFGKE